MLRFPIIAPGEKRDQQRARTASGPLAECPLHHSQVITIRGDSYRLREKRRAGLIKAAPLGQEPSA